MGNIFNFHGNVNMNVYCKKCTITEEPDSGCGLEINSVTVDFDTGFIFELTNTSGTHVKAVITINDGDVELGCQETTSEYIIPLEAAQVLFGGQTLTFTSYSDNCSTSTCEVIIPISFSQLEIPVTGENTIFELNGEPVCTEDSSYSVVLAGPNSIVINNTNGNLTIPAQEIESDGPGGVYIYYYICGGEVVYFMGVFMANPQGPQQMYSCDGNTCVEDNNGQYDHPSCYGNCNGGGGGTMYSCNGLDCIEDANGQYNDSNCYNQCVILYSCVNNQCVEDENGSYNNDYCDNNCPLYSCDGGDCIEDINGNYINANCNNECIPPIMYSCSGEFCIEDINGIYDHPSCYGGECFNEMGLKIVYNLITNTPVADPTDVTQWNTLFNLPANGVPFVLAEVSGNQITLLGGSNIILYSTFYNDINIISIEDTIDCVIQISYGAFSGCTSLISVVLDNVTSIGESAFYNCTSVTEFNFPLVTTLSNNCFNNCLSVTTFTLPSLTNADGNGCFYNCSSVTTFNFPALITAAGNGCFYNCASSTDFIFPSLTTVGINCFNGNSLPTEYNYPLLTFVENQSFMNCSNTTFNFPSLINVSDNCFNGCSNSVFNMSLIETAAQASFANCTGTLIFDFPNLTTINSSCFGSNSGSTFDLPSLITATGNSCFGTCSNCIFDLPALTTVGDGCFLECNNCTYNIPLLETAGLSCFYNSVGITSLVLNALLSIGDYSFYNLSSLNTLTIPLCTTLGSSTGDDNLFPGVSSPITVTVPVSLQTIDGGSPDGDLVYLLANNPSATINYV